MDFERRLSKAIERGRRASEARARADAERALSEQELRGLHTQYRLELCERIETGMRRLQQHFPGFRLQPVAGERGWGSAVSRDDLRIAPDRRRAEYFSRLEMTIRSVSEFYLLELAAKATVFNKEVFNRTHFQRLTEVDLDSFHEIIDLWLLEFAEHYAAQQ